MKRSLALLAGLAAGLLLLGITSQAPVAAEPPRVGLCHRPNAEDTPRLFLEVDAQAVDGHLAHGDFLASAPTGCQPTAIPTATPSDNGDGYD